MDYHKVNIGSGDFILPEVSTMEVLYRDGEEDRNETRYSGCHEFTGESTIRFDDPDEPGSAASAAKAELKALPPKTRVRVKIDPPLNSDTAAAGDPITGVVEREVKIEGPTAGPHHRPPARARSAAGTAHDPSAAMDCRDPLRFH